MVRRGHGQVTEHGHHLAAEHGQLLWRDVFLGEALLHFDCLGAQAQIVRPPVFGETAQVGQVDVREQRCAEPLPLGAGAPRAVEEQVVNQLLDGDIPARLQRAEEPRYPMRTCRSDVLVAHDAESVRREHQVE